MNKFLFKIVCIVCLVIVFLATFLLISAAISVEENTPNKVSKIFEVKTYIGDASSDIFIPLFNPEDNLINVVSVQRSCDCVSLADPNPSINPKSIGEIRLKLTPPSMAGEQIIDLVFITDSDTTPIIRKKLSIISRTPFRDYPENIDFGSFVFGASFESQIKIFQRDPKYKRLVVNSANNYIQVISFQNSEFDVLTIQISGTVPSEAGTIRDVIDIQEHAGGPVLCSIPVQFVSRGASEFWDGKLFFGKLSDNEYTSRTAVLGYDPSRTVLRTELLYDVPYGMDIVFDIRPRAEGRIFCTVSWILKDDYNSIKYPKKIFFDVIYEDGKPETYNIDLQASVLNPA